MARLRARVGHAGAGLMPRIANLLHNPRLHITYSIIGVCMSSSAIIRS